MKMMTIVDQCPLNAVAEYMRRLAVKMCKMERLDCALASSAYSWKDTHWAKTMKKNLTQNKSQTQHAI